MHLKNLICQILYILPTRSFIRSWNELFISSGKKYMFMKPCNFSTALLNLPNIFSTAITVKYGYYLITFK